ncbi:MAG: pyridoxal-dependent decarboxylase [Actinomycetes bacterium]
MDDAPRENVPETAPHMTPDEFRRYGREVVDWVADYWERVGSLPVLSRVEPGDVRAALPDHPPERPEPFADVLADLDRVVVPGLTHWQHPRFFGYYPANASGPAVLGDLLASGLGVQGMLWSTSPASTELETHVVDWLAGLLGLPEPLRANGVVQDSASSATLVALLAGLFRASGGAHPTAGVDDRAVVYASTQTHSSAEKAVRIAGLGTDRLRLVDVDPKTQAMLPDTLRDAVEADLAAGLRPAVVIATIGTTSTGAVDPVGPIGEITRAHGMWLHVDAAYAGVAAVCPEFRWLHDGLEHADSYCANPHKWLLTNFDCDTFWTADRASLLGALSVLPEFLRNRATESGAVIDHRDWGIPLGRRFRALKLWLVLRWYGAEGLRAHIRTHVGHAQAFASWVRADPRFEVVAPHPLSLVCFRLAESEPGSESGADEATRALLDRLNAGGEVFCSHTTVNGRYAIRMAIGATQTERRHVEEAWATVRRLA